MPSRKNKNKKQPSVTVDAKSNESTQEPQMESLSVQDQNSVSTTKEKHVSLALKEKGTPGGSEVCGVEQKETEASDATDFSKSQKNAKQSAKSGGKPAEKSLPSDVNGVDEAKKSEDGVDVAKQAADGEGKSKAQLRAERRAIQEAQRAAKAVKQQSESSGQQQVKQQPQQVKQQPQVTQNELKKPQQVKQPTVTANQQADKSKQKVGSTMKKKMVKSSCKKLNAPLRHLQEPLSTQDIDDELAYFRGIEMIHDEIVTAGEMLIEQFEQPWNQESFLVTALMEFIEDQENINVSEFLEDLENQHEYLTIIGPLPVGLENIIKHLKYHVKQLPPLDVLEVKKRLTAELSKFANDNLVLAQNRISTEFCNSVEDGDIIVACDHSRLILKCLVDAKKKGKQFRVIVMNKSLDCRGIEMLEDLLLVGVEATCVTTDQILDAMKEATKAVLTAEAVFANGSVMTTTGGGVAFLAATRSNVTTVVLCETFRFSKLLPQDSSLHNQLGKCPPHLNGSNGIFLKYSIVPRELVAAIITEIGFRSPTCIETVLRSKWVSTTS